MEQYIENLCQQLLGRKYGDFTFCKDRCGSYYLESTYLSVYCTPFWGNDEGITVSVDLYDEQGELTENVNYIIPAEYPADDTEWRQFTVIYNQQLQELATKYHKP